MRKLLLFTTLMLLLAGFAAAQGGRERTIGGRGAAPGGANASSAAPGPQIAHKIRSWQLLDLGTRADSLAPDTLSTGFQVHSPAYRAAVANVQLGNLGAPWMPAMVSELPVSRGFLFTESLGGFFKGPEEWRWYNTTTPYTNLYYQNGGPKRRSEEVVGILFTQNINRFWNVGFQYDLISSIGRYDAQKSDSRHFRFFSSHTGKRYELHSAYVYNKTDHLENGGVMDEDYVLNPDDYDFGREENIPVLFYTASNRTDNHQLYLNQALDIGNLTVSRRDGESAVLPVGTAIHTLHIDRRRRVHRMDDLGRYFGGEGDDFYQHIYVDTERTFDRVYETSIQNSLQLKFNEEANALLRFGLRGFVTNEVERLRYPALGYIEEDGERLPVMLEGDTTLTSTLVGGQVFKNLGEHFRWNAGARFYFQGYRSGDTELTGALSSSFGLGRDTAGVEAYGGMYLNAPGFFEERYFSNHFAWEERFDKVQTLKVGGAVKLPGRRLSLSAEGRIINDYVFWNEEALPEQTSTVLSVFELQLFKHFSGAGFNSRNTVLYQMSSHQGLLPLPEWAIYSSNYYENVLFKVLHFQLGFDLRYNSLWFAPAYMPATGQFHVQNERQVGDYPFVDVFLNMQLKRARIFVKLDHVTQGLTSNQYFHTAFYPANPRGLRFGVSWNFYD